MIVAIYAFLFDAIFGDPETHWHPVALIGRLISFWEKIFYRQNDSDTKKLFKGVLLVFFVLVIAYAVAAALLRLSYHLPDVLGQPLLQQLFAGLLLSFTISPKSLAQAGRGIYTLLLKADIKGARHAVGLIVGRDTEKLPEDEIVRATVETIAENTSDGIIAPLFFFVLGGVPLAFLYRAANTLDSMLGYKNEKYLYFGRGAARLDDLLNYIPARVTGVLFLIGAGFLGFDARHGLTIMRRDARKHPSPNGGYCEASLAGALHIRLGGYNSYFGKKTFRAYMGDPIRALAPHHIMESIRMMYTATILFLVIGYLAFQLLR